MAQPMRYVAAEHDGGTGLYLMNNGTKPSSAERWQQTAQAAAVMSSFFKMGFFISVGVNSSPAEPRQ